MLDYDPSLSIVYVHPKSKQSTHPVSCLRPSEESDSEDSEGSEGEGEATSVEVGKLPTVAKDDATVARKLAAAKKQHKVVSLNGWAAGLP